MAHHKKVLKEDLPPRYSIDDCPPDYYDIYPPKSIPLSSLAKVTSPAVAATTVTTATNDTITPSEAVPNDNAVTAQSSSSQAQHDEVDESQQEKCITRVLWKLLLILSVVALIVFPPVGLNALIWSCLSYHHRHDPFGQGTLPIAIGLCVFSYVCMVFTVMILLTVFVFI